MSNPQQHPKEANDQGSQQTLAHEKGMPAIVAREGRSKTGGKTPIIAATMTMKMPDTRSGSFSSVSWSLIGYVLDLKRLRGEEGSAQQGGEKKIRNQGGSRASNGSST
jgi:hypothetical protein